MTNIIIVHLSQNNLFVMPRGVHCIEDFFGHPSYILNQTLPQWIPVKYVKNKFKKRSKLPKKILSFFEITKIYLTFNIRLFIHDRYLVICLGNSVHVKIFNCYWRDSDGFIQFFIHDTPCKSPHIKGICHMDIRISSWRKKTISTCNILL